MKTNPTMFSVLALIGVAATTACPGTLQDGWSTDVEGGGPATVGDAAACPDIPTAVFATTCAASGCHDAKTRTQGLDLQSPGVASRLVGVLATEGGGWLIDTSTPSASVIYTKVTATPPFGARMPVAKLLDDATIGCMLAWVTTQAAAGTNGSSPDAAAADAVAPSDAANPPPFAPIRVACGQTANVTDGQGNAWSADQSFTGGTPFVQPQLVPIAKTDSPTLYNGQRYGSGGGDGGSASFSYAFTVPDGDYNVTLKFAELFATAAGQRKFNVAINGTSVESDFDVFAAAGAASTAVDKSYPVHVSSGQIAVMLSPGAVQNPMVDAIEIVSAASSGDH